MMTLIEIEQKYRNGEITYQQYQQMLDDFIFEQSEKELQQPSAAEPTPYTPEQVFQYLPTSDVYANLQDASGSLVRQKMKEGKTEEQAQIEAIEELAKITRPTTTEYIDPVELGISRVDLEKGVKIDKKGLVRQATMMEKLAAPFGRQVIGQTKERKQYVETEAQKLKKRMQELDKEFEEGKISAAEYQAREQYEQLKSGAAGVAFDLLAEPDIETGMLVETPLATGLRYLDILSGVPVAAAAAQQFVGDVDVENDFYRVVDAPFKGTDSKAETFIDQVLLNAAKGQGIGGLWSGAYVPEFLDEYSSDIEMFAYPLLAGTEYISGGDRQTQAFILGTLTELGYPAFPGSSLARGVVKSGQKGMRAAARVAAQSEKAGSTARAKRLYAMAHPVESVKLRALSNKVASDVRGFGLDESADSLLKNVLATADDTTPQALSRSVRQVSANKLADRMFEVEMIKRIDNPIDLYAYASSPTMERIFRRANPTGELKGRPLIEEIQKVAADESNNMRKFAEQAATATEQRRPGLFKKKQEMSAGETETLALFNKSEAMAQAVSDIRKGIEDASSKTLKRSPLLTDYFDELGKVQLAARVSSLVSGNEVIDMAVKVEDLIKQAFEYDDLSTILQAGKQALAKDVSEKWLNFLPDDLHVIVGSRVVPTEVRTDKDLMEKYHEANRKIIQRMQPENLGDPVITFDPDLKDTLMETYIRWAGADKIRQSEYLQGVLFDLKQGIIKKNNYDSIEQAVHSINAEDVLGAVQFKGGGEQLRRALVPAEAKGDVIAITREKNLVDQLAKGRFGNFTRDFIATTKALRYNGRDPLFIKSIETVDADLLRTIKTIDSKRVQLPQQFDAELKQRMAAYQGLTTEERYAKAMDEMMLEAHEAKVAPMIKALDDTVQRAFNNDYVAYMHLFMNDKYGVQILNSLGVRSKSADELLNIDELRKSLLEAVEKKAKDAGVDVQVYLNDSIRNLVIDYRRFQETINEWSSLVKGYYGQEVLDLTVLGSDAKDLSKSLRFKDYIVVGGRDRFTGEKSFQFLSKKTSYLDISYTNFLEVVSRMEESLEGLKGRGLKSVKMPSIKSGLLEQNVVYNLRIL